MDIFEEKTAWKLKHWPTPQDYNEAVQNLRVNLQDSQLYRGEVYTDRLGIPRPMTGNFASVYKIRCGSKNWALRCFLREVPDSSERYSKISDFVQHDTLSYTVGFDYQKNGIKVGANWFPILKMDWVDGSTLDNHIRALIQKGKLATTLATRFKTMCSDLRGAGIAHGDLQHGNIIVRGDEFFLVDYDGMYVPAMRGSLSIELGHRNYQHPKRNEKTFGPYLDNFSSWVIHTSLNALSIDSSLYEKLGAGEDCLLFRHDDFVNPLSSPAFAVLENHAHEEIKNAARFIRWQLDRPPEQVPPLDGWTAPPASLTALSADAPTSRSQPRLVVDNNEPQDWMHAIAPKFVESASTIHDWASAGAASHRQATTAHGWPQQALRIETELTGPTPRRVMFNRLGNATNPWFFQLICLLNPFLWILFFSYGMWQDNVALQRFGIDVPGQVLNSEVIHHSKGSDDYRIYYKYNYGKETYTKFSDLPVSTWTAVTDGQAIEVRILPERPTVSVPSFYSHAAGAAESEAGRQATNSGMSFLATLLVNLGFELAIWFTPMMHQYIVRNGNAVQGKIVGKQMKTGTRGGLFYYVDYRFQPDLYGPDVVRRMQVNREQYNSIRDGQETTIVYIPKTRWSVIYSLATYRARP